MKESLALYRQLLGALPAGAGRFLRFYSTALAALSLLDAAAVALLAVIIGPLSTNTPVKLPFFGTLSGGAVYAALGIVCGLIVLKGILSVILLWGATRRFAGFELQIGSRLFDAYLRAPWVDRLKRNSSDIIRVTDSSVSVAVSNFLLPGATLAGETASLIAIIVVLALAQPAVAITTLLYLGALGAMLYFWIARNSRKAGEVNLRYTLRATRLITEVVGAMKEVTLRHRTAAAEDAVATDRRLATRARANVMVLGQVPRYVLESGIVGGFVLVGAVGYVLGGAPMALTSVALFALAGFRLAPSVTRFQTIVSQMTATAPHARRILEEMHDAEASARRRRAAGTAELPAEVVRLSFDNVSFRYSAEAPDALSDVSFEIPLGSTVAFVGASGSGKSTTIDLILGLLAPTEGRVLLNGEVDVETVLESWQRSIGYVPQDVSLFDATIAQNVALSWTSDDIDRTSVQRALEQAQLLDVVDQRDNGIDSPIGERGLALSGGQRQRMGIARALYAAPSIVVMDEATSALDTITEAAITNAINELPAGTTVVIVAHRLSTVRNADQIFFMREGRIVASGTFDELIENVPDFAAQAQLAGLA